MYKLKLVLGLRKAGEKSKGKLLPTVFGAIAAVKVLDKGLTEMVGADNVNSALNTNEVTAAVDKDTVKYFRDLTIPQVFEELRKSFNESPVNTDADILISIGSKNRDFIKEFIPRAEYRSTHDSAIIKYFLEQIKTNPQLRVLLREK